MALLRGLGRIYNSRTAKATGAVIGGASLIGGIASTRPMKPWTDMYEEELLGDPNAMTSIAGSLFASHAREAFMGDDARQTIRDFEAPMRRSNDFRPPGAMVFGMYNARRGGN